ncbi:MAG: response regulator [Ignavibacteriales bacterium]|nr:response regulator [Ignavibacteriales bacterium]
MPPGKENKAADQALIKQNKEAAKQCLLVADRLIKEADFEKARIEVERAQKLDPSHPYISAFLDRIAYFEEQKKKNQPSPPPVVVAPKQETPGLPVAQVAPPPKSPSPPPPVSAPTTVQKSQAAPPPPPSPTPKKPVDTAKILESLKSTITPAQQSQPAHQSSPPSSPPKPEVDSKLDEMRNQIQQLTQALQEEKKAREEIREHQLQGAVNQLRHAMEKAWINGAPKAPEAIACHQLALSLNIPPEVEKSVQREVKIEMYSRAVKEVISKRKLLRSSSSTLEWLRKVYQITVTEYLENESKFLLDLVADQYKGTVILVSEDSKARNELTNRLKASGYAVVLAQTPELALEKVEKINPNVILCEQKFTSDGALSGIKFMHILRTNSKLNFIPCVLFCEKSDLESLKASELRANEAIVKKPVDFDELTAVMNEKLVQFREYISSLV